MQTKAQKPNLSTFIAWIKAQNEVNNFAELINDGTTVYFSDDFAACYDLRIIGFEGSKNTIVVQVNMPEIRYVFENNVLKVGEDQPPREQINESLFKLSVETWTKLDWEVWYLDSHLKWMIIANEKGSKKYTDDDLIQSDRINFQFKLNQIG